MPKAAPAAALAAALLTAAPAPAGEAANTLAALTDGLNRCFATMALPRGTDVTVLFSLNRRGALIGKPRLAHAHWPQDGAREAAKAIAEGFDRCLPVAITDALGGAIAGHPFAYRFRGEPPAKPA